MSGSLDARFALDPGSAESIAQGDLGPGAVQIVLGSSPALALQHPTEVASPRSGPSLTLQVFRPFIVMLNGTRRLSSAVRGKLREPHHIHSPAEIELLIAESRDGGLLEPDEHRRLHRALQSRLAHGGET